MLTVVLALALAAADAKDPGVRSKELFAVAKKLYEQGRYADAVKKFEEAYEAKSHPVLLFNIGKCYEQLGDPPRALRSFRDYLRLAPEATDQQAIKDAISNLERKLRERGVQQVLIFADPPVARIEVDGKDLGVSPASVELTAGSHPLVVKAPGFETLERTVNVSLQHVSEVSVALTAVVVSDTPTKSPELAPRPPPEATAPAVVAAQPAQRHRVATWVAGGVAVAGLGAAIGLGVVANSAANDLHASQHTRLEADALVGRASTMALGADVAYAVAGTAAITAVVLFFVEGR